MPHHHSALARRQRLVRERYIVGEDGSGGAFSISPSKAAAQRGRDAEWFPNVKARTGSLPTIRYFDLTMIVDNETCTVAEFRRTPRRKRRSD